MLGFKSQCACFSIDGSTYMTHRREYLYFTIVDSQFSLQLVVFLLLFRQSFDFS